MHALFPKDAARGEASSLPSGSELVLKKARPSAFCTCFEKSASFGFLPKEGRPSLPSGSFTSGGEDVLSVTETSSEGSELVSERSFTSGGFPKEANLF